ncbi:uncharacterized protein [Panulirus ornatus]|uniref:uncharacterized protein n=1 Tax=Panulirus ornatus TaxID=150431 RepID=UPI003A885862
MERSMEEWALDTLSEELYSSCKDKLWSHSRLQSTPEGLENSFRHQLTGSCLGKSERRNSNLEGIADSNTNLSNREECLFSPEVVCTEVQGLFTVVHLLIKKENDGSPRPWIPRAQRAKHYHPG